MRLLDEIAADQFLRDVGFGNTHGADELFRQYYWLFYEAFTCQSKLFTPDEKRHNLREHLVRYLFASKEIASATALSSTEAFRAEFEGEIEACHGVARDDNALAEYVCGDQQCATDE